MTTQNEAQRLTFEDRCKIATDCLPKSPYRTRLESLHAEMIKALRGAVPDESPVVGDAANLIYRHEREWHRMGELWERCQGKGWPDKESAEFHALRDEKSPATRAALLSMLKAAPQPAPGYRLCEFCGCHTNAKRRACCEAGKAADTAKGEKQ